MTSPDNEGSTERPVQPLFNDDDDGHNLLLSTLTGCHGVFMAEAELSTLTGGHGILTAEAEADEVEDWYNSDND